jgi:hypothetical protein
MSGVVPEMRVRRLPLEVDDQFLFLADIKETP